MDIVSGVGVIDKAFVVLNALAERPHSLATIVQATDMPRATAHRLLLALEQHGAVRRMTDGQFCLGTALIGLGVGAQMQYPFVEQARRVAHDLRDAIGESVQVYVAEAAGRRCIVSFESTHGLRWIVPEGSLLPLSRGSAGRLLAGHKLSVGGWIESVEEREKGVASVSAPIFDSDGDVIAALSVSGPLERLSRTPGKKYGAKLVKAARLLR
ncbi:MAG: helix-turn-helix domain-containing protein [Ilumatobacteraceae bacterium]|nr:helix-turn-helix domain-containing protein [Ilumatobacteraceae bacterium]